MAAVTLPPSSVVLGGTTAPAAHDPVNVATTPATVVTVAIPRGYVLKDEWVDTPRPGTPNPKLLQPPPRVAAPPERPLQQPVVAGVGDIGITEKVKPNLGNVADPSNLGFTVDLPTGDTSSLSLTVLGADQKKTHGPSGLFVAWKTKF